MLPKKLCSLPTKVLSKDIVIKYGSVKGSSKGRCAKGPLLFLRLAQLS